MNIIFLGMKHCGKSTCASSVSQILGLTCLDTDDLMSEFHLEHTKESLTAKEIFAKYGSDFFKVLEKDTVHKLALDLNNTSDSHIIALGGGTPMNGGLVAELKETGAKTIYLQTEPATIFSRVKSNGPSRFLSGDDPLKSFIEIAKQREPFYLKCADVVIDTSKTTGVDDMVAQALKVVKILQKEEA